MRELESKYPSELVVIGVQSGKYHAERITTRIRDASIRLEAAHPVVNDRQFRVWRSYAVSAWPTLVVVDPSGYVVGSHAGEFTADILVPFIEGQIENARAKGTLRTERLHFRPDSSSIEPGRLRYPGKIAVEGDRIAIADSASHRVIIGRLDKDGLVMTTEMTAGTGEPGFKDGLKGQFHSPQGMAFSGDVLYVADAENHSIRSIQLTTGEIGTLAGTGKQMRTRADQQAGAMSSPWDVTLVGETLFVAMAGVHQVWAVDPKTGRSRVHSGTGGEDIHDGKHREALLAQPMGITSAGDRLFVADSESSAIRWADVSENGSVGTIVGTGLFDFGDVDGEGDKVRLQHPQGVASLGSDLLVADSYNDCIKIVNPESGTAAAWLRGMHEPGGIACTATHAYVADTNAHRIAVVEITSKSVTDLRIE